MNQEGVENPAESFPQVSEMMIANMLQIQLMQLAFKIDHPEVELDMSDRDKRHQVGTEWKDKYAEAFREYVEDNPRQQVNLNDETALLEFLMNVKEYTTTTVH